MNNSDIDKQLGKKGMSNSDKFKLLGAICSIALSLFLSAQSFFECGKEED